MNKYITLPKLQKGDKVAILSLFVFVIVVPETKISSVINFANGPEGACNFTLIVGIFILGYVPQRAVPPQSMTAHKVSSFSTGFLNASTAVTPANSAIFSATG